MREREREKERERERERGIFFLKKKSYIKLRRVKMKVQA